jgi:hypothetical protein
MSNVFTVLENTPTVIVYRKTSGEFLRVAFVCFDHEGVINVFARDVTAAIGWGRQIALRCVQDDPTLDYAPPLILSNARECEICVPMRYTTLTQTWDFFDSIVDGNLCIIVGCGKPYVGVGLVFVCDEERVFIKTFGNKPFDCSFRSKAVTFVNKLMRVLERNILFLELA